MQAPVCIEDLVWIFTTLHGTQWSCHPSLTFDKGMQTVPIHCNFPLQHRCWTLGCAKVKINPDKSLIWPQCESTHGSLSVTHCYELFMVSLEVWIPRGRGQLWPVRSWKWNKVSKIKGIMACLLTATWNLWGMCVIIQNRANKQQANIKSLQKYGTETHKKSSKISSLN